MSIIAVRKTENSFEIASDQQTTWGGYKYLKKENTDVSLKVNGKVFQVNDMTVGCAGDVGHIGLLQMFCKNHSPKSMILDDIIEWFTEFKDWANKKAGIIQKDVSIHGILIKEKRCFTFFDHFEANEVTDFDAVGSGMFLAWGAMEVGATAERAVEVACKYDLYCSGKVFKLSIPV